MMFIFKGVTWTNFLNLHKLFEKKNYFAFVDTFEDLSLLIQLVAKFGPLINFLKLVTRTFIASAKNKNIFVGKPTYKMLLVRYYK